MVFALGERCRVPEILSLLNRNAQAKSTADVWDLATGHFKALGLSRANYGFTRFRSQRSVGDPDDAVFLTTAGEAFPRGKAWRCSPVGPHRFIFGPSFAFGPRNATGPMHCTGP